TISGCISAVDVPIQIGGRNFDHHIFISKHSIGNHDIILGQPFLQEFSARIDYDKGNHCKLYLWENDPSNPRNATAIRGAMPSASATIQEVYNNGEDEDFYE
ncbi:hypothetical protein F5050DRAFT_1716409, partial [Lentinula boryana]